MKPHTNHANREAVSGWEDDGGARPEAARRTDTAPGDSDQRRSQQQLLDRSHQSNTRGEHRYGDHHQTAAEQQSRQERDDLKQRLASRATLRQRGSRE